MGAVSNSTTGLPVPVNLRTRDREYSRPNSTPLALTQHHPTPKHPIAIWPESTPPYIPNTMQPTRLDITSTPLPHPIPLPYVTWPYFNTAYSYPIDCVMNPWLLNINAGLLMTYCQRWSPGHAHFIYYRNKPTSDNLETNLFSCSLLIPSHTSPSYDRARVLRRWETRAYAYRFVTHASSSVSPSGSRRFEGPSLHMRPSALISCTWTTKQMWVT